eukprot:gnl/MRDRNA2_/MRDRNA2_254091_c0_seq1.p1 gnl/MRDRNA2_/MRDRNA2_254091_c0~~gnl/MRDRNA2_/MRDRNA2_254091_c0_seq1.p1  ORF type:complete len:134 (-),score=17.36 gnl/MRDRNA2_/MRDRNA2_254091_c0_seq1:245-646(-)
MQAIVLLSFLLERCYSQESSPHMLGLLLAGGSEATQAETSHVFLFEWLNIVVFAVLSAFLLDWQRRFASALVSCTALFAKMIFLISLAAPPMANFFDMRWRRGWRLLIVICRAAGLLGATFCNPNEHTRCVPS